MKENEDSTRTTDADHRNHATKKAPWHNEKDEMQGNCENLDVMPMH